MYANVYEYYLIRFSEQDVYLFKWRTFEHDGQLFIKLQLPGRLKRSIDTQATL